MQITGTMIEVSCQISIKQNGVSFLDPAKTELLREISRQGSLSAAARVVNISYQHAWSLIEEMNRVAPEALVIKQRGVAHGGGAVISGYGERILKEYKLIEGQMSKFVSQINVEINL